MSNPGLKKILYVDDETLNLDLFQISFESIYSLFVAESPTEGIEIVKQNQDIDLIISDMHMPEMDGIDFIEKAKEINPNIPCIILSGYQRNEKISEALESGLINNFLSKPFGQKNLEMIIEKNIIDYRHKTNKD